MLDDWLPITTKTMFLDMNGTFMFGHDCFDEEQDFYPLWSRSQPWKEYLTTRLGTSVYSGWVFSSDIGVNKPAREIFDRALAIAKVDASDVVMVGDDVERDIRPAAELGMKTIWLSKDGHGASIADCVIAGLDQLL